MRVFVLGHRGMLGHVVARHLLEQGCEVVTSCARYEGLPRDPLIEAVRDSECAWIVNAAGLVKQKCDDSISLLLTNSILPLHLKSSLRSGQRLIHASTDCVFSGERGGYRLDDERDAADAYGLSKILAEAIADDARCTVIRASVIGPETGDGRGLMNWFQRQRGEVNGFTNHLWNGITTLEWAKLCCELIRGARMTNGVGIIQPGIEPAVSKYELLALINRIWDRRVIIKSVRAPRTIDRTLVPSLLRPALSSQLAELKEWYERP